MPFINNFAHIRALLFILCHAKHVKVGLENLFTASSAQISVNAPPATLNSKSSGQNG